MELVRIKMREDMEVDKENVMSGASGVEESISAPSSSRNAKVDDEQQAFSPELLRFYYARLFPYEQASARVYS